MSGGWRCLQTTRRFLESLPAAWDSVIVRHDQGTHVVDGIQTCLLWRLSRRTLTVSFVKSHSSRFAETIHVDCRLGSTRAHLKSMNSYDNVRSARTFSRDVSSPNKFRRSGTRPRNNTNYMCYKRHVKATEGPFHTYDAVHLKVSLMVVSLKDLADSRPRRRKCKPSTNRSVAKPRGTSQQR